MATGKGVGKNVVVKLDNYAGSLQTLTSYADSTALEISAETDSAAVFGDRGENHTVGLFEPGDAKLEGPYDETLAQHMARVWLATTSQTMQQHPRGTTTGNRYHYGETYLQAIELTTELNGTGKISTTHKFSGAITFADN